MIRCIAIDDEPLALKQICSYISNNKELELVAQCSHSLEALEAIKSTKPDLMFVDINMPQMSGLELVRSLGENKPLVIFTTAFAQYAVESFKVDAIDYLLKPFNFQDFMRTVNKAAKYLQNTNDVSGNTTYINNGKYLYVKSDYKMVKVNYNEIVCIASKSDYVSLFMEDGSDISAIASLKNIEDRLPSDTFMRVHRSYIINMDKVKSVVRSRILLNNDTNVPLGDQYKDKFYKFIEKHSMI